MGIGGVGTSISTARCILKGFPAHEQNLLGLFINSQIKLNLADVRLTLRHIQAFQRGRGEG